MEVWILTQLAAVVLKGSQQILVSALQAVSDKLMAGFVECLDNEEAEEGAEGEEGEADVFWSFFLFSSSVL